MMRNDYYPAGVVAITPGATQLNICGFVVGVAGTVTVTDSLGNTGIVITAAAGIPIMGKFVAITAATATGIVGFVP
jgi:hypothetical protein